MSEDKVYPLTTKKRAELRAKGLIPFSLLGLQGGVIALSLAFLVFFLSTVDVQTLFANFYQSESAPTAISIEYLYSGLYIAASITGLALTLRLLLSGGLVMPLGRHSESILREERKLSLLRILESLSFQLILCVALFFILRSEVYRFFEEPSQFLGNSMFQNKLLLLAGVVGLLGIVLYALSFLRFFEKHKMSREEIIEEASED